MIKGGEEGGAVHKRPRSRNSNNCAQRGFVQHGITSPQPSLGRCTVYSTTVGACAVFSTISFIFFL